MKEIMINGSPVPIHFGIGALKEMGQGGKLSFSDLLKGNLGEKLDSFLSLFRLGLNHGARYTGSEKRYSEEEAEFMIDDNPEIIKDVLEIFRESIACLTDKLGGMYDNVDPGNAAGPKTSRPRAKTVKKTSR